MKKVYSLFIVLPLLITSIFLSSCQDDKQNNQQSNDTNYSALVYKAQSSVGLSLFMYNNVAPGTRYNFTIDNDKDSTLSKLKKQQFDFVTVPIDIAEKYYETKNPKYKVINTNAFMNSYILAISTKKIHLEDLNKKKVCFEDSEQLNSYGYLSYIQIKDFDSNGKSCLQSLEEQKADYIKASEPEVSKIIMKNPNIHPVLDLTNEFNILGYKPLVESVTLAKTSLIEKNPEIIDDFVGQTKNSILDINTDIENSALKIDNVGMGNKDIQIRALPDSYITFTQNKEAKDLLKKTYQLTKPIWFGEDKNFLDPKKVTVYDSDDGRFSSPFKYYTKDLSPFVYLGTKE